MIIKYIKKFASRASERALIATWPIKSKEGSNGHQISIGSDHRNACTQAASSPRRRPTAASSGRSIPSGNTMQTTNNQQADEDDDDGGGSSSAPAVLLLPDDMLADVLRRLPPSSLAASRCVRKQWCSIIDARCLLHVDLLPLQLDGFF